MIAPIRLRGRSLDARDFLTAMQTIRGVELALQEASVARAVEGPLHVSLGEEAVAVGLVAAMDPRDVLLSNHRGHGHALAMGLDVATVIAEVVGHPDGFAGGRGGSMHIFDPESGFLGTNGIVGGNAGVAVGTSLALQLEGDRRVAVVVFGDGAMGTGIVYESINLAALWKLPVVFVCENNGYAEMTPTSVHLSSAPSERARGFGLTSMEIDGTDVEKVATGMRAAIETAREGEPVFVEAVCFRFGGHYAADPARYRPKGEDDDWRSTRCPIALHGRRQDIPDAALDDAVETVRAEAAELVAGYAA
ncbi:thiamine pyrophosphate-dependent dehydrogenase E1 component subunit alpha [Marivibrio halodurans]|uniref:Thiamine pyrophosphate-dependent dehydrogenase E1 component subunit alpha n=1 Tax=Marivibrio halodurans TaxID=2039722 RepID=A0A8J7SAM5_9PROT|nr:thiamine pyrophosphate-dependent dehydrogenase E1 component subunit alpha [Marivibrio halodurans]MBP5858547.1 thiamine pyrophosphate-dependent dehydrogenase E1 component subunit alpha [Marivibrio halodurans]